jgi:hypothetical protein
VNAGTTIALCLYTTQSGQPCCRGQTSLDLRLVTGFMKMLLDRSSPLQHFSAVFMDRHNHGGVCWPSGGFAHSRSLFCNSGARNGISSWTFKRALQAAVYTSEISVNKNTS